MRSVALERVVEYCDRTLDLHAFTDYEGALNGLQVQNRGTIHRIGAAVDGSLATLRQAVDARANLLLVHHGLFWADTRPWTGHTYALLRLLLDHDIAVYAAHLPLDGHRHLGNAVQLARALGWKQASPFFLEKGRHLGCRVNGRITRDDLQQRLARVLGNQPRLIPAGPKLCRRIGICTGGAGSHLAIAKREGVDTFITGEGPHWTYAVAEAEGINVIYAGHYATETFGVRALAGKLSRVFHIPWVFIDHPTGL